MPQFDPLTSASLDCFGPDASFHHVGMVVREIASTCPGLEKFFDPAQDVSVAFVNLHGATIEFIEPGSPTSPVSNSLAQSIKLVHLCYSVPDLESAIAHAKQRGFRLIARPVPAVAFGQRRIAWVFHQVLGLFELLELAA
jgi:glyoxalase/bleomycin resistance protein/dioxygenase superfamily protein